MGGLLGNQELGSIQPASSPAPSTLVSLCPLPSFPLPFLPACAPLTAPDPSSCLCPYSISRSPSCLGPPIQAPSLPVPLHIQAPSLPAPLHIQAPSCLCPPSRGPSCLRPLPLLSSSPRRPPPQHGRVFWRLCGRPEVRGDNGGVTGLIRARRWDARAPGRTMPAARL